MNAAGPAKDCQQYLYAPFRRQGSVKDGNQILKRSICNTDFVTRLERIDYLSIRFIEVAQLTANVLNDLIRHNGRLMAESDYPV